MNEPSSQGFVQEQLEMVPGPEAAQPSSRLIVGISSCSDISPPYIIPLGFQFYVGRTTNLQSSDVMKTGTWLVKNGTSKTWTDFLKRSAPTVKALVAPWLTFSHASVHQEYELSIFYHISNVDKPQPSENLKPPLQDVRLAY